MFKNFASGFVIELRAVRVNPSQINSSTIFAGDAEAGGE